MSLTHPNESVSSDKGLPEGILHTGFFPDDIKLVSVLNHELAIEALRGELHPKGLEPEQVKKVIAQADDLCESASMRDDTSSEHAVNMGLEAAHLLFNELQEAGVHSGQ